MSDRFHRMSHSQSQRELFGVSSDSCPRCEGGRGGDLCDGCEAELADVGREEDRAEEGEQ